jgi:alkyl hydroperoxide reductase subunit AhpF
VLSTLIKEKRQNIDLKNQLKHYALKLKRTWSFKDNISEDQQQNITKIIEDIRRNSDDFEVKITS